MLSRSEAVCNLMKSPSPLLFAEDTLKLERQQEQTLFKDLLFDKINKKKKKIVKKLFYLLYIG